MTHPFDWLSCPHCGQPLNRHDGALRCPGNHTYDIARQGYVNLLGHAAPKNADTPAMLDARARFLGSGLFGPIADAVADAAAGATRVLEVGAGTGYYLAHTLDALPDAQGLATDVSVAAAKRAARVHPRAGAVVADTWAGLPVADGAVDALLCVFAPRNPAEFGRVLEPGGRLVVVVPLPTHLREIRARHGLLDVPEDKAEAVTAAFPGWDAGTTTVERTADLTAEQTHDLIAMGPNAFHGSPAEVAPGTCSIAVTVLCLTRT
ncbi:putative RNA methyltransferase [Tessaracoccus sp. ZS01]|uniref:putative RNA methyltransferase n=1 Tax=Tessaracoccus sp. ZS01 TaxID=1906324 RepID=UPI00096EFFA9|nr:methyltransferase domain-containing protein [Tessaracoccus sp. ZS01]MCG6566729.1 methyltransferase domain-containing protein [Tessaracoccus sp. ZS01]OMG59140.1 hypothetical protein BJN44_03685 [Tessaracoccus sp. ZS01]